jgi:hypothetical protein
MAQRKRSDPKTTWLEIGTVLVDRVERVPGWPQDGTAYGTRVIQIGPPPLRPKIKVKIKTRLRDR